MQIEELGGVPEKETVVRHTHAYSILGHVERAYARHGVVFGMHAYLWVSAARRSLDIGCGSPLPMPLNVCNINTSTGALAFRQARLFYRRRP